jgi:hypothetical protein
MKSESMVSVLTILATVAFFSSVSQAETPVKFNQTGLCFANNSNCDWLVGVWVVTSDYSGYSCSGNGQSTFPSNPADLCCTDPYQVLNICAVGYEEDNGLLLMACMSQATTFNNVSAKEPAYATLSESSVTVVESLEGGLQTSLSNGQSVCYPFRQLTTDNWVANLNSPAFSAGNAICPEFPVSTLRCNEPTGQANTFTVARRRIPASRTDGYHVTKNFNTKGTCDISNKNCDWYAGSWDGFVVAQGFSFKYLQNIQDYAFPLTPSDVLCAATPYLVTYKCENGYSTLNGNFVSNCIWGSGKIIPNDESLVGQYGYNGALRMEEYTQTTIVDSLNNGIQFQQDDIDVSGCTPFDRFDSDTIIGNVYPSFPAADCIETNTSPDLNVRCSENGDLSVNVGYFVLTRVYGSGNTGGPIYIASGATMQPTIMAVVAMFFLGFFMM